MRYNVDALVAKSHTKWRLKWKLKWKGFEMRLW